MDGDAETRERAALHEVTERLVKEYHGALSGEDVARTVNTVHRGFDGRPIRDFVPVLVERLARQALQPRQGPEH